MTTQQRYDAWIDDVSHVTLAEAAASGKANYLAWVSQYWDWVQPGGSAPSGGDRPPHKPPTP